MIITAFLLVATQSVGTTFWDPPNTTNFRMDNVPSNASNVFQDTAPTVAEHHLLADRACAIWGRVGMLSNTGTHCRVTGFSNVSQDPDDDCTFNLGVQGGWNWGDNISSISWPTSPPESDKAAVIACHPCSGFSQATQCDVWFQRGTGSWFWDLNAGLNFRGQNVSTRSDYPTVLLHEMGHASGLAHGNGFSCSGYNCPVMMGNKSERVSWWPTQDDYDGLVDKGVAGGRRKVEYRTFTILSNGSLQSTGPWVVSL